MKHTETDHIMLSFYEGVEAHDERFCIWKTKLRNLQSKLEQLTEKPEKVGALMLENSNRTEIPTAVLNEIGVLNLRINDLMALLNKVFGAYNAEIQRLKETSKDAGSQTPT